MRIAFDYQIFFLQSYGGISRYFTRLAEGLQASNVQAAIFAPLHRNMYLSELTKDIVKGRHISHFPPKTIRLRLTYNQLRARFAIAKWKPDLVHETYYAKRRSVPQGYPTVVTVYDMIHELLPDAFPINDYTAIKKSIAIDRADHVICISENTKRDLIRLHGTSDRKISVVHLGFDQLNSQEVAIGSAANVGKPFLLYVGERSRSYKNFGGFLKAVASSNRLLTDFDIVAFGETRFSASELELMRTLGFAEKQVRQQSGSDALLGSVYSKARALVYPSLYEGFGIPPLEAMAHGCPVISSNTSSMPEVIGSAGEYFDPRSIEDIRRAIESVVYSDTRIESLRQCGFERLKGFSWKECTKRTLDIYRTLVC